MTKKQLAIPIIGLFIIIVAGTAAWAWSTIRKESSQQVVENSGTPQPEPERQNNGTASTPAPEIISSDINTNSWKSYRNEEFEFEVRYPEKFDSKVESSQFYGLRRVFTGIFTRLDNVEGRENASATLSVFEKKEGQGISDFVDGISGFAKLADGKKYRLPSGLEAFQFNHANPEVVNLDDAYVVEGGRYFYLFNNVGLDEYYRGIVSTFQPITNLSHGSEADTSGWRVYRSDRYKFEFKYPAQYEAREKNDVDVLNDSNVPLLIYFVDQDGKAVEEFVMVEVASNEQRIFIPSADYYSTTGILIAGQDTKAYYFDGYDGGLPYIRIPLKNGPLYYIITLANARSVTDTTRGFLNSLKFF